MAFVLTSIVSNHGFRDGSPPLERLGLAAEIAKVARGRGDRLAVLPAGYLLCTSERRGKAMARALAVLFGTHGVSLLAGIDVSAPASRAKCSGGNAANRTRALVSQGQLPFFVFAAEPPGRVVGWWRQRSTSGADASLVPSRSGSQSPRTVRVAGLLVAVIACGEIFNREFDKILADARPDIIIDLGHESMGRGFQSRFPGLAQATGAPVLNAQHVAATSVTPRKWRARPNASENPWTLEVNARAGTRAKEPAATGLWAELLLTKAHPRGRS